MRTNIPGVDNYVLQEAITGYSDEAYTNAKKINSTGVVTSAADGINVDTETYVGQMRWFKPLDAKINLLTLTDPTPGQTTSYGSEFSKYVKSARSHGAEKVNIAEVVSKDDGLAKIGRDFAETRAQDEHDAILSVLKGVAIAEALNGAASGSGQAGLGGQTFDNDPNNKCYGFYVDLGAAKPIVDATTAVQGAARAEGFLRAFGMAYKDYEPEYAYLFCSPETVASLRSANLVDSDKVSDGNINFETIFGGKFRLIQTRAAQGFTTAQLTKLNAGAGVDIVGTKTSFIVLPGSIATKALTVPVPTEIMRDGNAFQGGGKTTIWYRWGYINHPAGYSFGGFEDRFASNADYMGVVEGDPEVVGNHKALTAATTIDNVKGAWQRKASSALSLGILPVFHS